MHPQDSHHKCSPNSPLKRTRIQLVLRAPLFRTPCKTELVARVASGREADIKDQIVINVAISAHSHMLIACRIPTLQIQVTVPSCRSYSGKVRGNSRRLILRAGGRSACPPWPSIWTWVRQQHSKRKLKIATMDLIWLTRANLLSSRANHKAKKRERQGLIPCLDLIVLLARMSTVVQIPSLTSSETWPASLETKVQLVLNRQIIGAKIKINASSTQWMVWGLDPQHLEQIMATPSPW